MIIRCNDDREIRVESDNLQHIILDNSALKCSEKIATERDRRGKSD